MFKKAFVKDERGSLADMTWVLGSAAIVVFIIVALAITGGNGGLVGSTVKSMWTEATSWIQTQIGF